MNRQVACNIKTTDQFTTDKMKTKQSDNIFLNKYVQHP